MVTLADLTRLTQAYPSGTSDNPVYALAGGSAMQMWLRASDQDRAHKDIDLFAFHSSFLPALPGISPYLTALFLGSFSKDGIVVYSASHPIPLQIIRASYFDAEITPTLASLPYTF